MRVILSLVFLLAHLALTLSAADDGAAVDPPAEPVSGYTLYPGDLLRVQVYDHPDLTVDIRVPTNGIITYPLIGDIEGVTGMSEVAFTDVLKRRLEDGYIRQAVITLAVVEYGPRRAYVMGSVEKPNYVELSPFAPLTATQAIGQVGGFSEDANRAAAQIIRDRPGGAGAKQRIPVPAADDPGAMHEDVPLRPGDLVIVPRLDRVYVIGQVKRPGAINLPSQAELSVSKAVSLAGGFDRFAKEDQVQLLRAGEPQQTVRVQTILRGGDDVEDPVLRPGDTVWVPESRF